MGGFWQGEGPANSLGIELPGDPGRGAAVHDEYRLSKVGRSGGRRLRGYRMGSEDSPLYNKVYMGRGKRRRKEIRNFD